MSTSSHLTVPEVRPRRLSSPTTCTRQFRSTTFTTACQYVNSYVLAAAFQREPQVFRLLDSSLLLLFGIIFLR